MSGYTSIAGIGFADDMQYIYTKANSVEDIDFQTAGILNASGTNITSVISRNINEWNPVITPGYGYMNNREYYAYADKCMMVWSIKDILNNNNFIYNDESWPTKVTELQSLEILNGYCASGIYTSSGYFGIKLSDVQERAPICVYRLPNEITPDYIDETLSGYVYFGTLENDASGFKYLTSQYLDSNNLSTYITASFIDNSDLLPRFAKYSPLAFTGFIETESASFDHNAQPVIGLSSGITTIPCISIYNMDFNPDETNVAQYLRDTEMLMIPGNIANIAIAYESSNANEIILRDININPLNATDENQLISVVNYSPSGIKTIHPSISDSVIASEAASISNIHYSITDENGIGASGFRLAVSIDKKYYRYDETSGYLPIDIEYEAVLMNSIEFYKLQLPSEYLNNSNLIVIDENNDVQFIHNINNQTGIYYTNSYGSLLGCGTNIVNTSGYLYTNKNGSATTRYLANAFKQQPRRSYIANIKATHPMCEDVYSNIYVQNTQQDEYYVSASEDYLPDIRTSIDTAIYSGSGYTLQNWPLGGPTAITFYKANEWFYSYATSSGIPTPLGIGQTINEHIHVTTDFVEPEEVVAIYKYVNAEILKSDDYTVLE